MASLPQRNLAAEVAKHFKGSPDERVRAALDLGRQALDLFRATLPETTTREQARAIMQRNKNRGRNSSSVVNAGVR